MRPNPVTKPSPGGRWSCMPKSTQRWRTNLSSSSNVPSSRRRWMRSRAVSLPALCSRSRRSGPPPASASDSRRRRSSMRSWCLLRAGEAELCSGKGSSRGRRQIFAKDADREMGGQPDGAEKQDDAEKQLRTDGCGSLERRIDGGDVDGGAHQSEHRGEGHRDGEKNSENGGEDHFHENGFAARYRCAERIAQSRENQNGRFP